MNRFTVCLIRNGYLRLSMVLASFRKVLSVIIAQIEKLAAKYETTFADVEDQIKDTEKELSGMIDLLTGSEFDMAGLAELKKMLGGM